MERPQLTSNCLLLVSWYLCRIHNFAVFLTTLLLTDNPGMPKNLRVTEVSSNYVVLEWNEPEEDGGSPIIQFLVQKRNIKRKMWQTVADSVHDTYIKVKFDTEVLCSLL